jgi:hypothetical protein
MRRLLLLIPLVLSACIEEIAIPEPDEKEGNGTVEVVLDISGGGFVKSSLSVDENLIEDISLVIYHDGIQEYHGFYGSPGQSLKLDLVEGWSYNIYVMANVGELKQYLREEDFRNECVYSIGSISEIRDRLPMAWSEMGVNVRQGMRNIDVQLERLVAKIMFSLDKNLLDGLDVNSVRLCQCASAVRPFRYLKAAGSRAESPSEMIPGDAATEADLSVVNEGGRICFYTLENCQGILLPDNGESSGKLPEAIGDVSGLCTYLEVAGRFGDEGFLDGEVRYRFYLGLDACSSFDVPGNSCIDVRLQLTDAGLHEVSWRVDADVSVRDGYAWGSVAQGLHQMDDLYVGEKLQYRVEVSDEILSYVGGDLKGCHLWFDSGDEALSFSSLKGEGKVYVSDILCREVAEGQLFLRGPDGEKLALLCPSVSVRQPGVVVAEYSSVDGSEPVEGLTYAQECVINGEPEVLYVYLTDDRGMNLNSSEAYGFALEAFDFCLEGVSGREVLSDSFTASFATGSECSGGYAALMTLSCRHEEDRQEAGLALAEAYGNARILPLVVSDRIHGLSGRCGVCVGILPVQLTLVDNGWAGFHDTQLSMIVENGSSLPLEIIVCQMVDNNKVWNSSLLTPELEEYVRQHLTRADINYITGSVNAYDQTMHVSTSEVHCVGEGVFPLVGIETDDLMKSLIYDKFGQDRMYHLVDVTLGGYRIYNSDVSLVNALSDGSSLYDAVYLSDWNSKGVWLYSDDALVQSAGNYLVHYPNVSPKRIQRMRQRHASCPTLGLQMWHDGQDFLGYVSNSQGIAYGVTMTVRFYGEVQGYVQTDPKGIWGSVQDNYCSASFDKTLKGVPLADVLAEVSMDGGAVKQAMDAIYAQAFEDKRDGKKFMHSAHPVSMDCKMEICVEGEKGLELYPMRVSWEYPYVRYYHAQDAMTYTCRMTVSTPRFNMVTVEKDNFE